MTQVIKTYNLDKNLVLVLKLSGYRDEPHWKTLNISGLLPGLSVSLTSRGALTVPLTIKGYFN